MHQFILDDVKDATERRVIAALADPKWDFRTVDGISRSAQVPPEDVLSVIRKYEGVLIRRSKVPDKRGRTLYTLVAKVHQDKRSLLRLLRTFITKSVDD